MDFNEIREIVNEHLTINQVVGYYLENNSNIRWDRKYTCPFHGSWNERTPSLTVSDSRKIFKCFWCNLWGDIVKFVMEYKNLTFFEALKEIEDTFDLKWKILTKDWNNFKPDKDFFKKKTIYEFHEELNKKMVETLFKNKEQLEYLKIKRKLTEETIRNFGIWLSLSREIEEYAKELLQNEKFKMKFKLKDTWLYTEKEGKIYFLFTNRIMYPIRNQRWKIIGWSWGRIYDNQEPKYINSVNNYIYNKSTELFNLDKCDFNNYNHIILCEWNVDSTQIYNFWWHNAVSLLWTNLTKEQIALFKNKVKNVVILLDNDEAWKTATMKIAKLLVKEGLIPYIFDLGSYKDIDEYLKSNYDKYFWNVWNLIQNNKKDILVEYLLKNFIEKWDNFTIERRYNILNMIKSFYEIIEDEVLFNIYKRELSKYEIFFKKVEEDYENYKKSKNNFTEEELNNLDNIIDNWENNEKEIENLKEYSYIWNILKWNINLDDIMTIDYLLYINIFSSEELNLSLEEFEQKFSNILYKIKEYKIN